MLKKIRILLTKNQKIKCILLFIGSIIASTFETIGIGSIPVFVMIIIDINILKSKLPSFVDQNLVDQFSQNQIALFGAIFLTIIFLIKNLYLVTMVYWQGKVTMSIRTGIRLRLFKSYISAPYSFHLQRNPAELVRGLTEDVTYASSLIMQIITIFRETLLLIMIFALLFYADPLISLSVFLFLTSFITLFYFLTKTKLITVGKALQYLGSIKLKILNQSFGSIKEVKLLDKEKYLVETLKPNLQSIDKNHLLKYVFTALPRPFLEIISVMTVVVISTIFVFMNKSNATIIPMISLLAVSIIRLVPAFNVLSTSLATIKTSTPQFNYISKTISELKKTRIDLDRINEKEIKFFKDIYFNGVNFRYENTNTYSIIDLNLSIKNGQRIGFIGNSGAGKSTLMNLLLGLLQPTNGKILIDGKDISKNLRSWQSQLGYVPQDIYLLDDTIRNNIVFFSNNNINSEHVSNVIKSAQLENFINSLPDREETIIGNMGVRLSGGQRQRIGIARALYNNPKILVLDEATSSLDNENEKKIINEIISFDQSKTLIIITHRHQTVQNCDNVFLLNNGRLIDQGKYDYLNHKYNLNDFIKKNIQDEIV